MLQRRQRDNLLIPCVANVVAHARLNGGVNQNLTQPARATRTR